MSEKLKKIAKNTLRRVLKRHTEPTGSPIIANPPKLPGESDQEYIERTVWEPLRERSNKNRMAVEAVIGKEAVSILYSAGISNLHVEEDGTISGSRTASTWYPEVEYIKNLSVQIVNDRPVINGNVTESVTDVGKII